DVVDRNSRRLLHLVGDLLLVAQSDAGELVLSIEDVPLSALVTECVESALPTGAGSNVELALDVEPDLTVSGDPVRLGQVLDNLVSCTQIHPSRWPGPRPTRADRGCDPARSARYGHRHVRD